MSFIWFLTESFNSLFIPAIIVSAVLSVIMADAHRQINIHFFQDRWNLGIIDVFLEYLLALVFAIIVIVVLIIFIAIIVALIQAGASKIGIQLGS